MSARKRKTGKPADAGRAPVDDRDRWPAILELGLSQSPVVFYVADLDREARDLFVSPNAAAITGHAPSAFLADPAFRRTQIHPDDLAGYLDAVEAAKATGAAGHEYRFRDGDGAYRWFRDELRLIPDAHGRPRELFGCMTDITERIAAERESRRLSRLLGDAMESVPNGFGIYDAEDRLILCNAAFAELFGETPEALVGTSAIDNTRRVLAMLREFDGRPVGDPEASLPRALARAREAESEPIEMQLKSGRWMQITSHPIADGGRVDIRTDITRLKAAEASLRESEEQFRSIVEANPSPVRVADLETWEILYESPAAAALFGRPWPSRPGRSTGDSYADVEARTRLIHILRTEGRVDNFETLMRRADGSTMWVALSSRVVRHRGRAVTVTSLVDLTEAKNREAELRQAHETLEDAIESLSEGLVLYDAEDRLVLCNSQYRAFHRGAEDLLVPGASWPEVTRTRAQRGLFAAAAGQIEAWLEGQMAQRGIAHNEEFLFGERWYEYSHRPTRQGGFVSTWRDITERKAMEESLRDSEALIRRVLEACPLPVRMWHPGTGRVLYESPACAELFGRDATTLPPQDRLSSYVDPADRERYVARLRRTGAVDNMEMHLRHADGTTFWASVSARTIDFKGEEVVVSSIVDLTERIAVEEKMARQREALHQTEKMSALGALLAGVAHELNNPLSVLLGQSALLQEAARDTRIAERAAKISRSADRCARIVRTFLAMARQQPSERAPVDLNDVVEATLEVTGYSLRTADIDVSLDLAPGLPTVWGNADHLTQVLTNLLVNAQQAMQTARGPRRVRVSTGVDEPGGTVRLSVVDSGPGIAPEVRPRIFEPFFTTRETGVGTGIGLAVCHRIVEAHGGRITVESELGHGAAFTLFLPVHRAKDAAPIAERAEARGGPARRVLVIDDEPDVAEMLADMLGGDGHEATVAASGEEALAALRGADFDAIFSDLRMPNLEGPGLFAAIRECRPDLIGRVAFVTGDTLSPMASEFLGSCGRPHIEKPFSLDDVRRLLREVVGG